MLPNYASTRSKSTTDIFRASSDLSGTSYPPSRKSANLPILNRRRRVAPTPPQRKDSNNSYSSVPDPEAFAQKRLRSYLTENNVRIEADAIVLPTQLTRNQTSRNFVKKLVATLERRQREQGFGFGAKIDSLLGSRELVRKNNARNTIPESRVRGIQRDEGLQTRIQAEQAVSRVPAAQLEDLAERDENDEEDDEEEEDWDNFTAETSRFWENEEDTPIHTIERKACPPDNSNINKSTTVKRTLKNMFSSMLSWRNAKSLPQGSREYYAARESLGEEMRAFRRDTMPRLMEHASVGGKRSGLEDIREEQREFSELIANPAKQLGDLKEEKSIATIRPVYGSNSNSQRRSWHKLEFPRDVGEKQEVVYGSIKVQPPAPPPRVFHASAPTELHLLRPSKAGDPQRRISRHESLKYSDVQLRKPNTSSSTANIGNNNRNSMIYDVPRLNPRRVDSSGSDSNPVLVEHIDIVNRITPPDYANVSGIIGAHDEDKRLRCTTFTTF